MTISRFIDPHIQFKERDVRLNLHYRDDYPMFSLVELNIWGTCNRNCEFCPISNPNIFTTRKEGIALSNYENLLNHLHEIEFSGVILWSMFSEPTLHKEISELALMTKKILPDASLQMTSNGDWIKKKPERMKNLLNAGVDRINLSLYDGPEQLIEFEKIIEMMQINPLQVKLRRRFLQDGNIGITISNRTGLIDSSLFSTEKTTSPQEPFPLKKPCYYPFYQVSIDYNGDVLLCPHDWGKKYIVGNAFNTPLWEIWRSKRLVKARSYLLQSDRSLHPCKKCDVSGDLIGAKNFLAFVKETN